MVLDLNKEMAWITFSHDGWESVWHPVLDNQGNHLPFDSGIMDSCRTRFNNVDNWITFGIAPTSQMLLRNAVRDNI